MIPSKSEKTKVNEAMTPSHKEVVGVSTPAPPQKKKKRHPGVFKRDYCYLLGTCRLSKYRHVGKCAGSIKHSL